MIAIMTIGCTDKSSQTAKESNREPQPTDTVYTQKAAMAIYGYQPERALQIIDSAVIVGNLSEVRADLNRARIYSQSRMKEQLDSLLGGQEGASLDTARTIGERLLQHDSLKKNPKLRQDVLEILVYTARLQEDSVRWLQRSHELVEDCRKHGGETKALRTEAELGASLCYSGQQEQGLAKLDSVIAAIGSLEPFRFYELDAYIIAAKRKIGVLSTMGREEETLPLSRRILELLDDYEQHPDKYQDGSSREPSNDTKRAEYIRFYRTQRQGFITAAYTALDDKGNMTDAYEKIERTVREAAILEHQARYAAMQQHMEAERQQTRADHIRHQAIGISIIALLAIVFAVILYRKNRDIRQKNRVLAQLLTKLYDNSRTAATNGNAVDVDWQSASPENLYRHIRDEVIRLQLYTDPSFGRQSIINRFHLTKDQASRVFSQGSEHSSISDFITECRLDHARRLLVSRPDMSIADIAAASGFGLRTTFTRSFKTKHGLTPTEFREQQEQS